MSEVATAEDASLARAESVQSAASGVVVTASDLSARSESIHTESGAAASPSRGTDAEEVPSERGAYKTLI